jgi:hypothetical protein
MNNEDLFVHLKDEMMDGKNYILAFPIKLKRNGMEVMRIKRRTENEDCNLWRII